MLTVTLVMFALTVILITRNEQFIFRNEGRLVVKPDPSDADAVIFYWRSEVKTPMARRFEEAFDEWKDKTSRIVIDLNSPGGAIREGEAMIREIDSMKRTHIVDTRVRNRRACYSMCVPIFLQGEERTAAATARFMFHEPTAYDYFTGEKVDEPAFEKNLTSRRFFDRYFVNSAMDPVWREKLSREWRGKDVYRSGRELVDEESNIVTALE
jgi:ClpP protease-like protein